MIWGLGEGTECHEMFKFDGGWFSCAVLREREEMWLHDARYQFITL